jgi:hypothetical protein
MADPSFCVHGHFYQPPREDPLTGEIPLEPGAAPYHNWNERIHNQCYRPNADLGNFAKMSFDVGPTLVDWMISYDPVAFRQIVEQDRQNVEKYGVGNAMAQAYNHTILPLATPHDKYTQVLWGIADFEYHFGHKPAGMWLPETAVNNETLEVLADCGIEYIILAPWQADVKDLDATHPYRVDLPAGKRLVVFFYNQDLSTRISFDPGATINADNFLIEMLMPKFRPSKKVNDEPQLVMIASDGELYGHHQPFRDKFLGYLLDGALSGQAIKATYPALWLKDHPVYHTTDIHQNTSWSCSHGVTRWKGMCSCTPHGNWKAPLRNAFDELARALDGQYLAVIQPLLQDAWQLRHQYIHVINGQIGLSDLVGSLTGKVLEPEELKKIDLLLKAQYERQRMFTSCGWFFDDFDRIEPRNNVAYAAQAVWLTNLATGVNLESQALSLLKAVKSWRSGLRADMVFSHHLQRAHKMTHLH